MEASTKQNRGKIQELAKYTIEHGKKKYANEPSHYPANGPLLLEPLETNKINLKEFTTFCKKFC